MSAKKPSVVFCPESPGNPYIRSLGQALDQLGWATEGAPRTIWFLARCSAARRADVLHLHWPDAYALGSSWTKAAVKSLLFLLQLRLCKLAGKRLVWTCHNLASHEGDHPRLQRWLGHRLVGLCDAVIAHSPNGAEAIAATHGAGAATKLHVVRHANYVNDYPNSTNRAAAREQLGIEPDKFVFLFVGAIRGYKGVLELIDDFSGIDDPSAMLVIAGEPRDVSIERDVTDAAASCPGVVFHSGYVATDEMQNYLAAADVLVLPYRKILTSGSLLLAASFAKPAIVPNAKTLLDTVDPIGVLPFDRDDPDDLKRALRTAIEARAELPARGEASRAAVAVWGWPEVAAATAAVYRGEALPSDASESDDL